MNKSITVSETIAAPIEKVWQCWTEPTHIMQWAFASDDWHAPAATNDVRTGGRFSTTMAAKDGSAKFDFTGEYTEVMPMQTIAYRMDDSRMARVTFVGKGPQTSVTETFEMETLNSEEMQRSGWQAILRNFKKHVETGK